jgi:hypothetical protein
MLGESNDGALTGLRLSWPSGIPRDSFARLDELIVIATDMPLDLRALGSADPLESPELHIAKLPRLQVRGAPSGAYYLKRLSYLLHPRDAALGGLSFEIDNNPGGQAAVRDPDAWLVPGVDAIKRPSEAAEGPEHANRLMAREALIDEMGVYVREHRVSREALVVADHDGLTVVLAEAARVDPQSGDLARLITAAQRVRLPDAAARVLSVVTPLIDRERMSEAHRSELLKLAEFWSQVAVRHNDGLLAALTETAQRRLKNLT